MKARRNLGNRELPVNSYDDLACEPLLELPPLFGHYELYKNNDLLHAVPFLRLSPPTFRSPCFRCSGSYIQSKTAGFRGLVYKHTGLQNVFHEGLCHILVQAISHAVNSGQMHLSPFTKDACASSANMSFEIFQTYGQKTQMEQTK